LRGDPKWTLPPLIGAVALFLVPTVTMFTIAFFTPKGELPPLFEVRQGEFFPYPYPAGSLQEALERNYKAIHETYEASFDGSAGFCGGGLRRGVYRNSALRNFDGGGRRPRSPSSSSPNTPRTSPRLGIRFCRSP
jgi:hypothetical protein